MFSVDQEAKSIYLYDEIGPSWWGLIDAASVIDALASFKGEEVTIRLNTPGGSVDEGIAIFNAIKSHKGGAKIVVDSLAASMGSYILQAGGERVAASNAMVMIHDPWSIAWGNSTELRKSADVLDKYAERMIPDYAARSGKTLEEITAIMQEETWYTAQDALEAGFIDRIDAADSAEPVVGFLKGCAKKLPQSLADVHVAAGSRSQVKRSVAQQRRSMTLAEAKAIRDRLSV